MLLSKSANMVRFPVGPGALQPLCETTRSRVLGLFSLHPLYIVAEPSTNELPISDHIKTIDLALAYNSLKRPVNLREILLKVFFNDSKLPEVDFGGCP